MARGGYSGPTDGLGLIGCLVLVLPYLFSIGFIIEDFGYGGAPGWQFALALVGWTAFAFGLAVAISRFAKLLKRR
jgi:hypothetical protein